MVLNPHHRAYGQFFTPEPVVACCYALLEPELPAGPRIVDPACGDGAFLCYAAAHGLAASGDLYGCDIDPQLVAGLAARGMQQVRHADGLAEESLERGAFDLVIGNPPFGLATTDQHTGPGTSEVRFLRRAVDLAKPAGCIALVLPSGVLANERLSGLRADLLRQNEVLAVIALPRATFRPAGTNAACSLLVLRRCAPAPSHRVFFAIAETLDQLPAIMRAYRAGATPVDGPVAYWRVQTAALAERLDAHFWQPAIQQTLDRMAARYPLQPLGALIGRSGLIAGDHVRPSLGERKGPGLPYEYYQTREFMPAGYNYAALSRCDQRAYRRLRRTAVRQHDVLVSCAGVGGAGLGRVCLVTHQPGPSCTGDVFILRAERPHPLFLFLFLAGRGGRDQLLRLQNGVGTVNLSADELLRVQVPLLPETVQHTLATRYLPIATAHAQAMAASLRGEQAAFECERNHSNALLAQLIGELEELLGL